MAENYSFKEAFSLAPTDEEIGEGKLFNLSCDIEKRTISADIVFKNIISYSLLSSAKEEVKKAYRLNDFILNEKFELSGEIKKTDAMAYCISKTEEKNALWWTIFDSCIINESEDGVTITLRHGNRQILEDEKVIDFLKTQMKLLFSVDAEIYLAEDEIEVTHELKPIFAQTAQEKPQEAEVIAVGPGGIVDGKEVTMQVKEGDKVVYQKYSTTEVKINGEEFLMIKQNDILAIIVED